MREVIEATATLRSFNLNARYPASCIAGWRRSGARRAGVARRLVRAAQARVSHPATPTAGASDASLATTARDEVLEGLLARADKAFAAGAYVSPPEENAADLYAQARRRNANDPRAGEGLEKVIDKLLSAAEQQLLAQHIDEAQKLTDQARAIKPDHVRVAFLTAEIGKERERAVLMQARQAAASGNLEQAIAVLDGAPQGRALERWSPRRAASSSRRNSTIASANICASRRTACAAANSSSRRRTTRASTSSPRVRSLPTTANVKQAAATTRRAPGSRSAQVTHRRQRRSGGSLDPGRH